MENRITEMQIPGTHIYADDQLVNALKNRFSAGDRAFNIYLSSICLGNYRGAITPYGCINKSGIEKPPDSNFFRPINA